MRGPERVKWYFPREPIAQPKTEKPAYTVKKLKDGATLITLVQFKPQESSATKRS